MKYQELKTGKDVRFGQNVVITGNVSIGDQTSVWHNVILRGDVEPITIGERCNIQDNTVVHGQLGRFAVVIGNGVSVGHSCIIHGCELADESFVGMGSIVMNGAYIGNRVLVAAGSLVPQNARFDEPNTLVMGRPGKVVRKLKANEIQMILETPANYIQYALQWLSAES
jgi:carbonic anhydrase/acetyltransferase-like protein (isoleucine patch superfamily)